MTIIDEINQLGDKLPVFLKKRGRKPIPIEYVDEIPYKRCTHCKKLLKIKMFSLVWPGKNPLKRRSHCKKCRSKLANKNRMLKRKPKKCTDLQWLNDRLEQEIEKNKK